MCVQIRGDVNLMSIDKWRSPNRAILREVQGLAGDQPLLSARFMDSVLLLRRREISGPSIAVSDCLCLLPLNPNANLHVHLWKQQVKLIVFADLPGLRTKVSKP